MADIEKVLKGLQACICGTGKDCRIGCPYFIPTTQMVRRCFERLASDAHELLKKQPQIVRCKDCKHYDSFSQECRDGIDGIMTPDFYCANGERKEGR